MAVSHIVIGKVSPRDFARIDMLDGIWRGQGAATNLSNLAAGVEKALASSSSAKPDVTISAFREPSEIVRFPDPSTWGVPVGARKLAVWAPQGGLHPPDVWAELVYVSADRDPLRGGEEFSCRRVAEYVRGFLTELAAQVNQDRASAGELWIRHGLRLAELHPGFWPVPKWRVDEAENPGAAAEAAASNRTGARKAAANQAKASKAKPKPAA